jgi:energy-coupling factor transporter transmembrane protein EcfT
MLSAGLAHLMSLPNKINLSRQDYMIAQQLYRGWSMTGIIVICAVISTLLLVIITRKQWTAFLPAIIGFFCLILSQVIFWVFTYPANRKTDNWNYLPDDWMQLRKEWEYSHAVASILDLFAFMLIIFSVLNKKPGK